MGKSVLVTAFIIFQYHMKMRLVAEVNLKPMTVTETTGEHKPQKVTSNGLEQCLIRTCNSYCMELFAVVEHGRNRKLKSHLLNIFVERIIGLMIYVSWDHKFKSWLTRSLRKYNWPWVSWITLVNLYIFYWSPAHLSSVLAWQKEVHNGLRYLEWKSRKGDWCYNIPGCLSFC